MGLMRNFFSVITLHVVAPHICAFNFCKLPLHLQNADQRMCTRTRLTLSRPDRSFKRLRATEVDYEVATNVNYEVDTKGRKRLQLKDEGWSKWMWKGTENCPGPFDCNYVKDGKDGVPIVFIHGFGAHAYHWRYQLPALSPNHKVYSLCLLGYGWSPKAVVNYSSEVWGHQVADFVREVVGEPAVLCGNSIGAIAALSAASIAPSSCAGLVMLNAAGSFEPNPSASAQASAVYSVLSWLKSVATNSPFISCLKSEATRLFVSLVFFSTKSRIDGILKQVYANQEQVDLDLVRSIQIPADDPQALETFQQMTLASQHSKITVPDMLERLRPGLQTLLLWGQKDPWMAPQRGVSAYKACKEAGLRVELQELENAGHCPHDDSPDAVNAALARFCANLPRF